MWKRSFVIAVLAILYAVGMTDATTCYQCDSWQNDDCNEDDYIDDKYLTPCSHAYQVTPTTCLKEVTTFLPGQIQGQLDRHNRYGRPHVMRRCGISLNSQVISGGSSNYQRQSDNYYEGCSDVGGEVIVNGVQAIRTTCVCLTDGCNSALPAGMINIATLLGAVFSALASSYLL